MARRTNSQRLDDLELEVHGQGKCLSRIEGELHDGLHSRVKLIERMQWWQIGIMVMLVGVLVAGLWVMLQRGSATARMNQKLLLDHIMGKTTGQILEEMRETK